MSERFRVMRLDEVDGYADEGRPRWHMIRSMLGIESFGINAWRATEAGQAIIGEHDELGPGAGGHEELYLVALRAGRRSRVDGELVAAPAGLARLRQGSRDARRSAVADEAATDDPRHRRAARARRSRSRRGSARPRRCASGRPATGTARSTSSRAQLAEDPAQRERPLQPRLRREPRRLARRGARPPRTRGRARAELRQARAATTPTSTRSAATSASRRVAA